MPATGILLPRQNVAGIMQTAGDVKNAFSSWDGCMSKAYCKWPVIVGIIIGSLIVLSIVWCFARCLCCGKDLVCCCIRCCSCCQPSRSHRDHKHLESVPPTPHHQQYRSHGSPVYAGPAAFSQTATFDSSTKVHADTLPQMPSWDTAASRKVEVFEEPESHELDRLKNDTSPSIGSTVSPPARPIPLQHGSGPSVLTSGPPSPHIYGVGRSPYGQPPGFGRNDTYGSRPDLNNRTNSSTALTSERFGNSPYGGGVAYSANTSTTAYSLTGGGNGYRDNYGGGPSRSPTYPLAGSAAHDYANDNTRYDNRSPVNSRPAARSPTYPLAGSATHDFANDNTRYDNRSPVNSRPGGNGGYATYNGNNYGGDVSPYGRGATSSPKPYGAAYSNSPNTYQAAGPARKPAPGSWREI